MAEINVREIIGSKSEGIDAHLVNIDDLCKRFGTVYKACTADPDDGVTEYIINGLTEEQAKENLKKYGPNKIERNMDEVTMGYHEFTKVRRENESKEFEWKQIKTEDLVPGDVVEISWSNVPAEKREKLEKLFIPADIRVTQIFYRPTNVESYFLYRECLNFEKMMTFKQVCEDPLDSSLETCNLIFQGSSMSGECEGIVFQTGENMLLSKVSPDLLASPVITDSDNEENEGPRDEKLDEPDITFHEDTIEKLCERFNTDVNKGLTAEQAAINQGESGKNKNLSPFSKIQNYTRCKRDGEFQAVLSKWLTIGDIISMKGSQIVPADIRIIEASEDCKVDKGGLTGDSNPQKVSVENTSANPLDTENLVFATTRIATGTCTGIVVKVGKSTVSGRVSGLGGTF